MSTIAINSFRGLLFSRKGLLGFSTALAISLFGTQAAIADLEDEARGIVEQTSTRLVQIISTPLVTEQKHHEMEILLERFTDFESISASVLGRAVWRTASKEQQAQFIEAFKAYLAKKYTKYFPDLIGGRFEIIGSNLLKKNYVEVVTRMYHSFGRPETVLWYVLERNGESKIYNLIVGDLNMLYLEREYIADLLHHRNGDLDQVIAYLPHRFS